MQIRGTAQEIEWLMEMLANGCTHCPYVAECSQMVLSESEEKNAEPLSCRAFLKSRIVCEIEN
ncbi:MAG: hypothetical protein PHY47_16755 [Lachnospiraceae bacterium]|nr:hypothetical protein [Lachnospiraceae bacterium]